MNEVILFSIYLLLNAKKNRTHCTEAVDLFMQMRFSCFQTAIYFLFALSTEQTCKIHVL